MASRATAAVVVVVAAMMAAVMLPSGEAALTCTQVYQEVMPCLTYIQQTGDAPPPSSCCSGISALLALAKTTADRRMACSCLKTAASGLSSAAVEKAGTLGQKCHVNIPYKISPSTDCNTTTFRRRQISGALRVALCAVAPPDHALQLSGKGDGAIPKTYGPQRRRVGAGEAHSVSPCSLRKRGVASNHDAVQLISNKYRINSTHTAKTTADRRAACVCLKSAASGLSSEAVNKAGTLAQKCHVSIPYKISPSTDCKSSVYVPFYACGRIHA
ncbi:hypothetical protein HPP92_017366 [Vanilla planifolia]|uniref:Non-specific lipid-transfer protein n=1 Tax=Vanilla planifolia TaxID=51239 RepID=A0A835UNI7_VANPL|nr:hypothetical protein HPP92_017366 [Vanilla planifolia]